MDGYAAIDLGVRFEPISFDGLTVALDVLNVTDELYSIRGTSGTEGSALNEAGRMLQASVKYRFCSDTGGITRIPAVLIMQPKAMAPESALVASGLNRLLVMSQPRLLVSAFEVSLPSQPRRQERKSFPLPYDLTS